MAGRAPGGNLAWFEDVRSGIEDIVPSALPGAIILVVLLAAAATYPVSWAILAVYGRAVRRSMRKRSQAETPAEAGRRPIAMAPAMFAAVAVPALTDDAAGLAREMRRRPWQAAGAYALAGIAYAAAMTVVMLTATASWGGPIRFAVMTVVFAWPVLLTTGIVAAPARSTRVALGAAYFVGVFVLGAVGVAGNPEGSVFGALLLWALYNGPATILLLAFLSRRIRAVGPLVFVFLLLAVIGANLILTAVGASEGSLRTAATPLFNLGLGATGAFLAIAGAGALLFAVLGWGALVWIRRRYESKALSDESVTLGAMWLIFMLAHSIGLLFEAPFAILAGPIPFVVFVVVNHVALAAVGPYRGVPPRLLLLRSFSIGADGERLFDALEKHWRRVGSIQMIAGYDLASRTVEPHEFLDFVSGRLARRFIDGPESFERRLREMDTAPDRDGRFRINDFFCYDDTWRMVLSTLVRHSHAVLMDLRGFTRDNAGCIFEIHELFRTVPLKQVVFVVNGDTDEPMLQETFRAASLTGGTAVEPRVCRLDVLQPRAMRALLDMLAEAAQPVSTSSIAQPR